MRTVSARRRDVIIIRNDARTNVIRITLFLPVVPFRTRRIKTAKKKKKQTKRRALVRVCVCIPVLSPPPIRPKFFIK